MLHVRILYTCTLIYILTGSTIILKNVQPQNENFATANSQWVRKQSLPVSLAETMPSPSSDQESDTAKIKIPLVKTAHKNVIELLQLFFIPKSIKIPIYRPLLEHVGIRLNGFGLLWGFIMKEACYEGGIDFYGRSIAFSIDLGSAYCKHTQIEFDTKGKYVIAALYYVMYPNPITNAYLGMGVGQSSFEVLSSGPEKSHWIKLILGSECRLLRTIPNLYGGMQLGIACLLEQNQNLKHIGGIPGYGKVRNINPGLVLYLKWMITFLEKR